MPTITAPTNPALTVLSTTSIKFTWQDNSAAEEAYLVYRSLDGTTYALVKKLNPNVESYTDTGLTAGTLYYYKTRAQSGPYYSAYTTAVSATTATEASLAAPTGLTAVPIQGTKVEINFTNASVGEDYHCIERDSVEITQLATGTTYYLDTGLTPGTTYTYRVRDLSGASTYGDYSSEATAKTPKPFAYIAYGSGTTDEGVALTALTTEIARAAATVEIVSTYTANDTVRFSHGFTADGAISVAEVGVFDSATGGTMLGRKKLATAVSLADMQTFNITMDFAVIDGGCGG